MRPRAPAPRPSDREEGERPRPAADEPAAGAEAGGEERLARAKQELEGARFLLDSHLDLMSLGHHLLQILIGALGAARGSLLMINPRTGRMRMVAGLGIPADLIGTDLAPVQRRISDWVFRERQSLILNGVVRDRRFDSGIGGSGIESALCMPLIASGETLGVVNLARVSPSPAFCEDDRRHAERLALSLAAILDDVQEIGWARESWEALASSDGRAAPPIVWSTPRYEIAMARVGSRLARADLAERVVHDDGSQTLLLADVARWGSEAHGSAAFLRGLFLALGRARRSPSDFAQAIDQELRRAQEPPAALWLAHLGSTGRLLSCVAGLPPPLVVAPGEGTARELTAGGPKAGAAADAVFDQESVQLLPGDRVLALTDGIPDASNAGGETFGRDRVRAVLLEHRQQPVTRLASALCFQALLFSGVLSPVDDLAALALRYSRDE